MMASAAWASLLSRWRAALSWAWRASNSFSRADEKLIYVFMPIWLRRPARGLPGPCLIPQQSLGLRFFTRFVPIDHQVCAITAFRENICRELIVLFRVPVFRVRWKTWPLTKVITRGDLDAY